MDTTKDTTKETAPAKKTGKYHYGLGRRKSAIAQVRLFEKGSGSIVVNQKEMKQYFPHAEWQSIVSGPLAETNLETAFDIEVKVKGGGAKGQAESVQLGIARALEKYNGDLRKPIKAKGFLSRDSRVKERKKPGLKGARRRPQWSKR